MTSQRGFTLLETAASIAIVGSMVIAASAAVARATHANAAFASRAALAVDADNVLSDLRAATAYDGAALARLAGRTYTASIVRYGAPLSVLVDVRRTVAGAPIVARATVTDADGIAASETRTLYVEAPAPGSTIDQPAPSGTP